MCLKSYIVLHILIIETLSNRFLLKRDDTNIEATFRNEKHFPNGSVVGTYTYKDENGNPINVRYYADDSSYGVELKSGKITEENSKQISNEDTFSKADKSAPSSDIFGSVGSISGTKSVLAEDTYKNVSYHPFEILNGSNKTNKSQQKFGDEYEIFLENFVKPSDRYNKEKFRVYVDKGRRKVRKISKSKYYNKF